MCIYTCAGPSVRLSFFLMALRVETFATCCSKLRFQGPMGADRRGPQVLVHVSTYRSGKPFWYLESTGVSMTRSKKDGWSCPQNHGGSWLPIFQSSRRHFGPVFPVFGLRHSFNRRSQKAAWPPERSRSECVQIRQSAWRVRGPKSSFSQKTPGEAVCFLQTNPEMVVWCCFGADLLVLVECEWKASTQPPPRFLGHQLEGS